MGEKLLGGNRLLATQPPPMQIAAPMNDVQLVALVAAQIGGEPKESVDTAVEIIAESVVAQKRLAQLINQKRAEALS